MNLTIPNDYWVIGTCKFCKKNLAKICGDSGLKMITGTK